EAEISEGFAAARGLALPSQLRRALRTESRDLQGEFLRLLPTRPLPIKVQRWTPRRVLLWIALVLGVFLLAADFTSLFTNAEATRAPLAIKGLDCANSAAFEAMLLEAQSVPT